MNYEFSSKLSLLSFSNKKYYKIYLKTKSYKNNPEKDSYRYVGIIEGETKDIALEKAYTKFNNSTVIENNPKKYIKRLLKKIMAGAGISTTTSVISSAVLKKLPNNFLSFKERILLPAIVGGTVAGLTNFNNPVNRALEISDIKLEPYTKKNFTESGYSPKQLYRIHLRTKCYPKKHEKDVWVNKGQLYARSKEDAKEQAFYKFSDHKVSEFKLSNTLKSAATGAVTGAVGSTALTGAGVVRQALKKGPNRWKRVKYTAKGMTPWAIVGAAGGAVTGAFQSLLRPIEMSDIKVELIK